MATPKIQDLKTLSKLTRISNNFNDVLIKSINQESMHLLGSKLRNSPRIPRNDITTTIKRRRKHPKLKTVNSHQWSHHESGDHHPLLDLSNNGTSVKSENDSTFGSNASPDNVFYNLIEYQGDDSTDESEFHIKNMSNSDMVKSNRHSTLGGSSETKFVNVEDLGITAKKTPKKIVFLIPAELVASVEIMKVQSVASLKTPSRDELFNGINQLPTGTTLVSSATDPELSDFLGPIKRQMKKNKTKRNAPYARRIVQNCEKENRRPTVKESSNAGDSGANKLDYIKLEIPDSYVPRDFQQTHGFTGPIRSKNYRNREQQQTTPLRSYSNSLYDMLSSNSDARINRYFSTQNVPATTIDRQSTQNPDVDLSSRGRNDRNKPYSNSKLRKVKLCWNCESDSHLFRQCPLA